MGDEPGVLPGLSPPPLGSQACGAPPLHTQPRTLSASLKDAGSAILCGGLAGCVVSRWLLPGPVLLSAAPATAILCGGLAEQAATAW